MASVAVLVAAYNNAPYIEQLLRSVLQNSFRDIRVLVRDDGSGDDTVAIARRLAEEDDRLTLLQKDEGGASSAKGNFFALMGAADDDYVMFCDADDFWLEDKIQRTMDHMRATEAAAGDGTPVLVHTDLVVADENLGTIAPSLFKYEKLSPERKALRQLLAQNNVTGCTVMINRALRELVQTAPADAVMHDWWLALVASAFGHIEVLYEPTILYRQHGGNEVGATNAGDLAAGLRKLRKKDRMKAIYDAMYRQADTFAETYKEQLSKEQYRTAKRYGEMRRLGKLGRIARIVSGGYYKNTLLRNIGQFIRC